MRKETFLLRVDGADTQRTLLDDFKTCIEFAANGQSHLPLLSLTLLFPEVIRLVFQRSEHLRPDPILSATSFDPHVPDVCVSFSAHVTHRPTQLLAHSLLPSRSSSQDRQPSSRGSSATAFLRRLDRSSGRSSRGGHERDERSSHQRRKRVLERELEWERERRRRGTEVSSGLRRTVAVDATAFLIASASASPSLEPSAGSTHAANDGDGSPAWAEDAADDGRWSASASATALGRTSSSSFSISHVRRVELLVRGSFSSSTAATIPSVHPARPAALERRPSCSCS
jgi:hypothetical protein